MRASDAFRSNLLGTAFLFLLAISACANSGCASFLGKLRLNAADVRFSVGSPSGPTFSQGATQTLRAYEAPLKLSQEQLDAILQKLNASPTPELVYTYVETSYLQARALERKDPLAAKRLYVSSALYAYHYLFNPVLNAQNESVFNAELLDVCVLYNGACERLLHLELQDASDESFPLRDGQTYNIRLDNADYAIYTKIETCSWRREELDSFQLVADRPVESLSFDCRRTGFGAPLIAKRRVDPERERPEEEYYPQGIRFPLTAILRPNPTIALGPLPPIDPYARLDSEEERSAMATLALYDPLVGSTCGNFGKEITLESDITTPLAYFLNEKSSLNNMTAKRGLLHPEDMFEIAPTDSTTRERTLQGLYMLEPYDPKKIPVVMTHGLGSSPSTWLEMYNALRNASDVQNAYQFWFYFYPTGQPFWTSAAQLRIELARLRETVDPEHKEPALDQIVLVGHSMGGLISRLQVQSSGEKIWNKISRAPFDEIEFDEETRNDVRSWFFFDANPSVKRVITIAAPFKGSKFANNFTQWIAERAIAAPQKITRVLNALTSKEFENIDDPTLLQTTTSVDSLSPACPIFAALDECETPSDVAMNNIVGVLPALANRKINPKKTDGVVDFKSSHRDDVESEREVPAGHMHVHTHPAAILEVKEILSRHLENARRNIPNFPRPVKAQGDVFAARRESAPYQGPIRSLNAPRSDRYDAAAYDYSREGASRADEYQGPTYSEPAAPQREYRNYNTNVPNSGYRSPNADKPEYVAPIY